MGTEPVIASSVAVLGIKTIVGSFFTLLLLLISYNLFKSNKTIKIVTYAVMCGLLAISTLILLSLALDTAITEGIWL
jgi:hypothetical protein